MSLFADLPPNSDGLMVSNLITSDGLPSKSDVLQPHSDGLQPNGDGLPPNSDGLKPTSDCIPPNSDGLQPRSDGLLLGMMVDLDLNINLSWLSCMSLPTHPLPLRVGSVRWVTNVLTRGSSHEKHMNSELHTYFVK